MYFFFFFYTFGCSCTHILNTYSRMTMDANICGNQLVRRSFYTFVSTIVYTFEMDFWYKTRLVATNEFIYLYFYLLYIQLNLALVYEIVRESLLVFWINLLPAKKKKKNLRMTRAERILCFKLAVAIRLRCLNLIYKVCLIVGKRYFAQRVI